MNWYEDEVKQLEIASKQLNHAPKTLFYGSSSIRLWANLNEEFKDFQPVNLGFGGSTLAACIWFFNRLLGSFAPDAIVLYAGDNDLGDGRNPEEVYIFFKQFAVEAQAHFGNLPCFFVSLKPSLTRWNLVDKFRYANQLIEKEIEDNLPNWHFINVFDAMLDPSGSPRKDFYNADGLHLSTKGYETWKKLIYPELSAIMKFN